MKNIRNKKFIFYTSFFYHLTFLNTEEIFSPFTMAFHQISMQVEGSYMGSSSWDSKTTNSKLLT